MKLNLQDFIFRGEALKLYRRFAKIAIKIQDESSRRETIEFIKPQFKSLKTSNDRRMDFTSLRSNIDYIEEMSRFSGLK
ncbi:unnamed protein product [Blepharisma stoltei]|uniref:Uncharacterized protein n=1 Tax=Blepharisma stoltei TaxID=1481888 RepID=A0AAU9JVE1_9CILI|nr:unnamed protein product [Blepharisma stoltei]